MTSNYIKTTLRHLWRNRLFTALNVLGLAIGISACWIIYRVVNHEFSYDDGVPNREHIYQVVSAFSPDNKMAGVSPPLYRGIQAEVPGLERVVPVSFQTVNQAEMKRRNNETYINDVPQGQYHTVKTVPAYFDMLPYHWLAGDKATALNAPESVVLTQSQAQAYFPGDAAAQIIGQTITYYGRDTVQRTVTGVVADFPKPSEFIAREFFPMQEEAYELYMWTNTNGSEKLYLQFRPDADVTATLALINQLEARHWKAFSQERGEEIKRGKSYELVPLQAIHTATDVSDFFGAAKTSKPVLYGLIGIGVFLLALACINYINMSVAQIPARAREIGVRKTLGSSRWQLIGHVLSETAVTSTLASLLAFAFSLLGFGLLKDIVPLGVTPQAGFAVFGLFTLALILLTTLAAGLYPSLLITKVKTVNVLKGRQSTVSPGRFNLQKALIVFQFFIALIFITSTIIVGSQLRYTVKGDMGFNKEAIVLVNIPWKYLSDPQYQDKQFTLLNELREIPGVNQAALGTVPLSSEYSSSPFGYQREGEDLREIQMEKKWIDTAYLDVYGMELLAGRNIRASDTINEFIINESAAKAFGFASPEQAIGQLMEQRGNRKHPITGVVADFHTLDFYTPIGPVVLFSEKTNLYTLNIKLESHDPGSWQATLKAINEKWDHFYPPHAFRYSFYDETLEALYRQERQTATLINLATGITIFISCLGLFGLATLTAFQRTKEIGIRKVLGASVAGVVVLLSKDFVKLVLIAMAIASPIAWWAMNNWLADFAYRIDIQWWMFVAAGAAALAIALLTVSWQAIRAALANPVDSLRDE